MGYVEYVWKILVKCTSRWEDSFGTLSTALLLVPQLTPLSLWRVPMIREGWRELCGPGLMMHLQRMRVYAGSGWLLHLSLTLVVPQRSMEESIPVEESQALHLVVPHEEGQMN